MTIGDMAMNAARAGIMRELRASNERMRDALTQIANQADEVARLAIVDKGEARAWQAISNIARAALAL